jgi:hypothetical protein
MATKFVCGADITFKGDAKFAVDPMGVFGTIEEAVVGNAELHPSFGYNIYEVDAAATPNLIRSFGFRSGSRCSGLRVQKLACVAYNHPAWPQG